MPAPFDTIAKSTLFFPDKGIKESKLYEEQRFYKDDSVMYNPYKRILDDQKLQIQQLIEDKLNTEKNSKAKSNKKEHFNNKSIDDCSFNKSHILKCNKCRNRFKENFDIDGNKDIINVALYGLTGVFLLFMIDVLAKK